jgi:hypothetical protein
MPISRRTTYTANTLIDAVVHNQEHDDYVAGINQNSTDITNLSNQAVKLTGDQTIDGVKGFVQVPYTTGGDPTTENSLIRKAYLDAQLRGLLYGPAPVYVNASSFRVDKFAVRSDENDGTIELLNPSVIDLNQTGINGIAVSSDLAGTIGTGGVSSTTINGVGTNFTGEFQVGDVIWTASGGRRIASIISAVQLTVESAITLANGTTYRRGGEAPNTWYFLYGGTDFGSNIGLLLSTRNVAAGDQLWDTSFPKIRQLPFAVRNDANSNLLKFWVNNGWPYRPEIYYDVDMDSALATSPTRVMTAGNATVFTAVNCNNFIPPISQVGLFHLGVNTGANSAWLRPTGSTSNGRRFYLPAAGADIDFGAMQLNATQQVDYRLSAAANTLDMDVLGFIVTEVA